MQIKKIRLITDVDYLTNIYPPRNYKNYSSVEKAASYIEREFSKLNCLIENQYFTVEGKVYRNVTAIFNQEKKKRLIVGAHYDVFDEFRGADDNASGVAGLLETARLFDNEKPDIDYRIDFVAYCLEEPPFFGTSEMGSHVHARSLLNIKDEILGMICLEMIGYFSDAPGSQKYPVDKMAEHYPDTGNFIIVGGKSSQNDFAVKVGDAIRSNSAIATFTITDPELESFLGMSDHSSYWKYGFNAVMINDTSMMRNPNYHQPTDTLKSLDINKMAEVVKGCYHAVISM